ncbi:MAG: aconitate hydratase [Syntrophales bacterium]|nr:aconitate hydratase [Syntrophales bacterium]
MGKTITQKIIEAHLVSGNAIPDNEIGIRIDQTLTQDATGTMAYLQFESMGVSTIKTDLSVSYIDHNTVQIGFENADDHRYLRNIAQKYGIHLSRPGNGICHQVHLERFGKPGATLIGADSHTPTAGALGMLAIGVGGLDVALAMAGEPFYFICPRTIKINLTGSLPSWVSAKDIILRVLQIFTTKGNVGRVFEYGGPGTAALSVPERATIANMGAECGVTTSIFPSDEMTMAFLKAEKRVADWREISADRDAVYERIVDINLSELEPMTAKPHSPDNIGAVSDMGKIEVQQVCLGSCTNSSYGDLATVACILKGRVVHPDVSFIIAPGSKQVLENIERDGYLADLISSGARFMENACGFCIGNSQSPSTKGVSLRTSNRNFPGRSGTKDADVYLVSPETAVAAVITGTFTDPRDLGIPYPEVKMPAELHIDDRMIIKPDVKTTGSAVRIYRGPNIGDPPTGRPLPDVISGEVTIKVGDNITTDHIMPAGDLMKYRSNIPKYAEFVFAPVDRKFSLRAKKIRDEGRHNFIVAGLSYGQGSSREQAAICPMHLGVTAIIARSFERIHAANLINFGILPLTIEEDAYNSLNQGDLLRIENIRSVLAENDKVVVKNLSRQTSFEAAYDFSERQKTLLLAGGALNLRQR